MVLAEQNPYFRLTANNSSGFLKKCYNKVMNSLPIVALIGQTNAGKSSILNRMAHKNIAIVAREEGTTRDNVMATIDNSFILYYNVTPSLKIANSCLSSISDFA